METLQVKPWGEGQGEFVVINKGDFVEGQHELHVEGEVKAPTLAQMKKALTTAKVEFAKDADEAAIKALFDQLPK